MLDTLYLPIPGSDSTGIAAIIQAAVRKRSPADAVTIRQARIAASVKLEDPCATGSIARETRATARADAHRNRANSRAKQNTALPSGSPLAGRHARLRFKSDAKRGLLVLSSEPMSSLTFPKARRSEQEPCTPRPTSRRRTAFSQLGSPCTSR
jgi:hypothetical protein